MNQAKFSSLGMKKATNFKKSSENGYSLLEVLIVLTIIVILASLAVSNFSRQKTQLQRQGAARLLKFYLEQAKFDSIKRRASLPNEMAKVIFTSPNSYILSRDMNQNGILEASEVFPVTLSSNGSFRIIGNFTTFPLTVTFNFRGQITAADGNNLLINPVFTFCDAGGTLTDANAENSNVIDISPSGTVSLRLGGMLPPNAVQPTLSNVSVEQKISQDGIIGN